MSPDSPRSLLFSIGGRHLAQLAVLLLPLLLVVPTATASKNTKESAAKKACLSGDYAKGVAILAELYVESSNITHLFNQGRCYEQNGKYEEAIVRFHEYQRKNRDAGRPPDLEAERHIAECQAFLDRKASAPAPAATPAPTQVQASQPPPAPASALQPYAQPIYGGGTPTAAPPTAQPYAMPAAPSPMPPPTYAPPAPARPVSATPAFLDLSARATPTGTSVQSQPVYKTWWFWTGLLVLAGGATTAIVLATSRKGSNVPSTPLGSHGIFQ